MPHSASSCIARRPLAGVLILHGLAEHAQRYSELAQAFAARDISTFTFDHRGHGTAPGPRTHIGRFDEFVDDALAMFIRIRGEYPSQPLFVWGHSMGAAVALLLASRQPLDLRGLIVTSNPLDVFKVGLNPRNPVFRLGAMLAPRLRIPLGLDATKLTHDVVVQRAYADDPCIPATASLRLLVEFAAANERAAATAHDIQVPTLVVHGENDAIAPSSGATRLHAQLGAVDKQLHLYPGLRHEVHNEREPERGAFIELVTSWIRARVD